MRQITEISYQDLKEISKDLEEEKKRLEAYIEVYKNKVNNIVGTENLDDYQHELVKGYEWLLNETEKNYQFIFDRKTVIDKEITIRLFGETLAGKIIDLDYVFAKKQFDGLPKVQYEYEKMKMFYKILEGNSIGKNRKERVALIMRVTGKNEHTISNNIDYLPSTTKKTK